MGKYSTLPDQLRSISMDLIRPACTVGKSEIAIRALQASLNRTCLPGCSATLARARLRILLRPYIVYFSRALRRNQNN